MGLYVIRRLLMAIPTLLVISLAVFALLDLAPGDPTSQLPLTIPAEIREQIRESLGFNDPFLVRWWNWNKLMVINEPIHLFEEFTGRMLRRLREPRPHHLLEFTLAGDGHHLRASAADALGARPRPSLRRLDRRADRHAAGLQAVLAASTISAPW